MRPWPLRVSMTVLFAVVLAALLTTLAVAFHSILVSTLLDESTRELEARASRLLGYLTIADGRPVLTFNRDDPEEATFVREATLYYALYRLRDGQPIEQSPGLDNLGIRLAPAEVTALDHAPGIRDLQTDEGRIRLLTTTVTLSDGNRYVSQVGEKAARLDRTLAAFDRVLVWRVVAGLAGAALLGLWLAGRGLAPLLRLAEATRHIDVNNLQQRLPLRGTGDELDQVAGAFNQALARVEHSVGEMRQFSAALAHELRTPLAVLRGQAELALKSGHSGPPLAEVLADQIEEFDRLTGLINQILTLARAEAGEIHLLRERVELGQLVADAVEDIEAVAASRQITMTSDVLAATVMGDSGWLRRLTLILVDNAIKYTPEGGAVAVSVSRAAGAVRLTVRDTGVGIPEEAIPNLFDRFYRVDPSRSKEIPGAGLGLALARWIAERHGASIEVQSRPGSGSTFMVTLAAA